MTSYRFSSLSDTEILSKLSSNELNRMSKFKNKPMNYELVITGSVGAGKSTICETISALFNLINQSVNNYPEYLCINQDLSISLLSKFIKGEISTVTFQNYVMDSWRIILQHKSQHDHRFNIYERCVDDSVLCFSNIANLNNNITDTSLLDLFNRMKSINQQYNLPSYFDPDTHFTMINSGNFINNINQILDIIESDQTNSVHKRIIGLQVSDYDALCRIKLRNRDGEDNYNTNLLKLYNKHYNKLFEHMNSEGHLKRAFDIGCLI